MKNLFLVIALIFTQSAFSGQALETNSFKEIEAMALKLGKKHDNDDVLIVLDIDNTLLTMPQELGSDQWFNWQYENCIDQKKLKDFCFTSKMGDLLDLNGKIFAVSNMIPTEIETLNVVKNLQKKGFKVILLTSRGPDFRSATERALRLNGFDFSESAIGPKDGYPGTYIPYKMDKLSRYGLTKKDVKVAKLRSARKISFTNGITMTAGLNKGIMLKTLLEKTDEDFDAIIFADDHKKHTDRMQEIMGNISGVELVTYRYGKIDPQVEAFKKSDKKAVIRALNQFQSTNKSIFK